MTDKPKTTTYNADSRTDPRGNPSPIPQLLRPPRSNYPEPDRPVLPPQDFSFDNQPPTRDAAQARPARVRHRPDRLLRSGGYGDLVTTRCSCR